MGQPSSFETAITHRFPIREYFRMNMSRAPSIISREYSRKLRHSVLVRRPSTAEPVFFELGTREACKQTRTGPSNLGLLVDEVWEWIGVTSIVPCAVCVPYIDENVWNWFAGVYIYDAYIEKLNA